MAEETRSLKQLPAPKAGFLLGHSTHFSKDPLKFLCDCERSYSSIVPLRLGLSQTCFLTDPSFIAEVLRERTVFVKNTPGWQAIRTLVGVGLLGSDGDFWTRQRKLTQPTFHQRRIVAFGELMVKATEKMLVDWKENAVRDIHRDMMDLTLDIVMQALLNVNIEGKEAKAIARALDLSMKWFSQQQKRGFLLPINIPLPLTRRYFASVREMDGFIFKLIQQRRVSSEDTGDLLSMLLHVKDETDGSQMSDRQLRDELATLMLAGHETTANALTWTWMLLAQNPQVEAKLHQELDVVLQGRLPSAADLPHLTFAQNILKESMRLYPPIVLMARSAIQDYVLMGCRIPKKCIVLMSPWVMHRSDRYFEDPLSFQPERWENDMEKRLPKCTYFPFGEGPRICIGKSFAQMESILILATIAQRYRLRLETEHEIVPFPSITLRPRDGLQMHLLRRQTAFA
ncbi:cytochrome P450 [Rubidibacter lacunae KORDI 51-2]|uniref:Cytochrome P450 n=1 Tax=Rubidibacter lacunae KORDI 51-2 TaxID=582515 RepID=U5DC82_9CHRO|nr:cytochrome P450 [Rubidibacter lacunae]ERN42138.1 cytochrome P450 [Rubidibacter lacunae KORDI 51-2]